MPAGLAGPDPGRGLAMTSGIADWLFATLLCVVLVELALRLPFRDVVTRLLGTLARALRVLHASSVSDHWKESAMRAYAGMTFGASIKLAGLLAFLASAAIASTFALDQVSHGFAAFVTGWQGALYTLAAACLYLTLQKIVLHGRLRTSRPASASAGPRVGTDREPEL